MTVAAFDNPATMAREAWQDGKLICHVQAKVLLTAGFRGGRWFPFYLNVGPWREGNIVGDYMAIAPEHRPSAESLSNRAAGRVFMAIGRARYPGPRRDEETLPLFPLPLILAAEGTLADEARHLVGKS